MLNSRALNATVAARPVRISGTARVSVSLHANTEPKPPTNIAANVRPTGAPAHSTSSALIASVNSTAPTGASSIAVREG